MLSNEEIETYLAPLTEAQSTAIRAIRAMIFDEAPGLVEEIDTGKWFGGLLTYHTDDRMFVCALGPLSGGKTTFHMMAFYGSKALQERYGPALAKLQGGKSCINFKQISDVPMEALQGIIRATPEYMAIAREMFAKRKKR